MLDHLDRFGPLAGIFRFGARRAAAATARALAAWCVLQLAAGALPAALACGATGGDRRAADVACDMPDDVEPASRAAGLPATSTANSIDLVTGNKYVRATDAIWPDGLVFSRHYNSRHAFSRALGPGWSHGYDTVLARVRRADGRTELQVVQGDGRRIVFVPPARDAATDASRRHRALTAGDGVIDERPDASADARFAWRWPDSRTLRFDLRGRLRSIEPPHGPSLALDRADDGRLLAVRSSGGLRLQLEYERRGGAPHGQGERGARDEPSVQAGPRVPDGPAGLAGHDARGPLDWRLVAVVQPDGSRIRYRYDAHGLLVEAIRPGGRGDRYRYDDPGTLHALTGVDDSSGRPRGRVRYDDSGRAVHSALGESIDAVTLAWRLPARVGEIGETVVTDARGSTSRYTWRHWPHEQRTQLLSAEGTGCAACPPVGLRWRYDLHGQLVEQRAVDGSRVWRFDYDPLGRLRSVARSGAAEPGAGGWVRFAYRDDDPIAPVAAVARPSVAPGRMRTTELRRDALGRLVERIERGYGPDPSSPRVLAPAGAWRPIAMRTRFSYHERGPATGRLAVVDGPLPGEADALRFDYDAHGRLVGERWPEGLERRLERDAFGRIAAVTGLDGVTARYARGTDGVVEGVHAASGGAIEWSRDLRGRPVAVRIDGAGRWSLAYDDADRLVGMVAPSGERLAQGSAGHSGVPPSAAGGVPAPGAAASPPGATPPALRDGGTVHAWSPTGRPVRRVADDFGRTVIESADDGHLLLHRHDTAGRRIATIDRLGRAVLFRHDALGRVVAWGPAEDPLMVQLRHRGTRVAWISDPHQTRAFRHDVQGRLVAEARLIGPRAEVAAASAPAAGAKPPAPGASADAAPEAVRFAPVLFVQVLRYDPRGRLVARAFGDGTAFGYGYGSDGRLSAVAFASREGRVIPVLADLRWHAFGPEPTGMRFGNGVTMRVHEDAALGTATFRHLAPHAGPAVLDWSVRRDGQGRVVAASRDGHPRAYVHDDRGRLVGHAGEGVAEGFAYDSGGNRVAHVLRGASPSLAPARGPAGGRARPGLVLDPDRTLLGSVTADGAGRHVYAYDARGERIAKLRFADGRLRDGTLYVHEHGLLSAELDLQGRVRRRYVMLGHRAVAVIDSPPGGPTRLLALHGDHLGTPLAATDEAARVVWRAQVLPFGQARTDASAPPAGATTPPPRIGAGEKRAPAPSAGVISASRDLALRLPGQLLDAETGLHWNYRRAYDPFAGRYLQADPLGSAGGDHPFAYAGSSPMSRIDPYGLYGVDVHYYLTYFLGRAAGVSPQLANMVALAAQYVDDNPDTMPETRTNVEARRLYHFVMVGHDRTTDPATRYLDPHSPQLDNLLRPAQDSALSACARAVFFGEYLHAYEDTFAHRDARNEPYGPILGHAFGGFDPDRPYDVRNSEAPWGSLLHLFADFTYNEKRTFAMANAVYDRFVEQFGTTPAASFESLAPVLRKFMLIGQDEYTEYVRTSYFPESESAGTARAASEAARRLPVLDAQLDRLGFGKFATVYPEGWDGSFDTRYSAARAARQRDRWLGEVAEDPAAWERYPGVMLPGQRPQEPAVIRLSPVTGYATDPT